MHSVGEDQDEMNVRVKKKLLAVVIAVLCLSACATTVTVKGPQLGEFMLPMEEIPAEIRPLIQKAEDAYVQGHLKESLRLFDKVLGKVPERKVLNWVFLRRGQIFVSTERYREAIDSLGFIIIPDTQDPLYLESRFWQGVACAKLGLPGQSNDLLRPLADEEYFVPRSADIVSMIADNYYSEGNRRDALASYADVLERDPSAPLAARAKGKIETIIEGECSLEELELIKGRYDASYPSEFILLRLGMRYIENGRYRHAKEILWEFIEKHRESPRFEEALSLYRRAVTKEKETQVDRCAVGCVVPLTGRYAPYGTKVLESILLASGVCDPDCNSEIKLIVRDSKGNAEETGNAIEALVLEDRVIVVIGPLGSSAAKAAAKKAQELKVPLVTLTQCEGITETGDYIFRNFLTSRVEMQNLVSYAVNNLGNRRFAVLYPGDSYGTEIMNLFSNAVGEEGGEIRAVQSYEREQTDFGDEIKGLVGLNSSRKVFTGGGKPLPIVDFDALFIADSAARARLIAPQLAFYDVTGIQLLGMSSWNTPVLVEGDSEYLEGAIFSDVFFHYSYYPEVVEFIDRFYAAYGRVPDGIESLAYDTAKIIKDIITGEIVDTRYEMRDRLCEVRDYQGTTGATTFSETGDAEKRLYILTVLDGEIVQIE